MYVSPLLHSPNVTWFPPSGVITAKMLSGLHAPRKAALVELVNNGVAGSVSAVIGMQPSATTSGMT